MGKRTVILLLIFAGMAQSAPTLSYTFQRDYFLAVWMGKQGKKEKAKKLLKHLVQERPDFFDGYVRLYELALGEKNWEAAKKWLLEAQNIAEKDRLIVDSDLLAFQVKDALKDIEAKEKDEKAEKAPTPLLKRKPGAEKQKKEEIGVVPIKILSKEKLIIYRGQSDGLEEGETVWIKNNHGELLQAQVEELRAYSAKLILSDTTSLQGLPRAVLFVSQKP